jgi:hypothetical protein
VRNCIPEFPRGAGSSAPRQASPLPFSRIAVATLSVCRHRSRRRVKDVGFEHLAASDCTDLGFRKRCVGHFKSGPTIYRVTMTPDGQLVLEANNQPVYRLAPCKAAGFRLSSSRDLSSNSEAKERLSRN